MESPCALALHYAESRLILAFLNLRVFLSAVAAVAIVFVLCTERITRKYHPNARLLIRSHFVFNLLASVVFVIVDGADSVRLLFVRDENTDCPIPLLPGQLAEYLKMPEVFCVNALGISLTCLGLERTVATVFARSYEKHLRTYMGWILVAATVSLAVMKTIYLLLNALPDGWSAVTTVGRVPFHVQQTGLIIVIAMEVVNVGLFIALYLRNRHWKLERNRINAPLAYKYQVEENVESLSNVLQLAFVHCGTMILSTVVFVILLRFAPRPFVADFGLACDVYALYTWVLPALLLWKMCHEKRRRSRIHAIRNSADEHKDHFQILNNFFNGEWK